MGAFVRDWGEYLGLKVATESEVAAGAVRGGMIMREVSSQTEEVM